MSIYPTKKSAIGFMLRSEENIGLVNGDYEKRTKCFTVFSGRSAFVSEQNE